MRAAWMPFGKPGAYWLLLASPLSFSIPSTILLKLLTAFEILNTHKLTIFAANNILQPPSEDEMLEAFFKAELK